MPEIPERAVPREEIERRAYEIYLARGCEDGYADADWLVAERELMEMTLAAGRSAGASASSADGAVDESRKPVTDKIQTTGKKKAVAAS